MNNVCSTPPPAIVRQPVPRAYLTTHDRSKTELKTTTLWYAQYHTHRINPGAPKARARAPATDTQCKRRSNIYRLPN